VAIPPATRYTLGRIGLFVVAFALVWPIPIDLFLRLLIAALISGVGSWFLLARSRNQMGVTIEKSLTTRKAKKERLRAALAGDDDQAGTAGKR
jgi:hypothetical protein